ncbi:MFS transporter [Frankia sp. CNm7]|uniref:MFS transporter n=1 Tax=Frankia nepalensis TaxID=1836974 RepID=A0A937RGA6_9ACTN|nr:MFS transporter [Frankia nepalensis]MBL7495827.1 MFS transporter [Frankia nepalensis]MBL7509903.1 MFS transporter [Frankia nepalensis]MBL7521075.1 MFS transporter [Frankia nepalensis]MBL7629662.1 MFS transporter [Frankia nepalensis]
MSTATHADQSPRSEGLSPGVSRLWRRELAHLPGPRARVAYLSIAVLTTILFYYQYYLISGVSEQVLQSTGMSFRFFVNINVVSALASALTSLAAGVCDRYGRANVVTVGVLLCALVCVLGFPVAESAWAVGVCYTLLGAFEGTVLVATAALVRDFSPQVGRATAMGFWTVGPVAGSLVTSAVVSNTADDIENWQDQYLIAGLAGLGVFVVALLFLRELAPALRDQVMVSERDRALVEARARGLDVDAALRRPFRQMLRLDIVGSAVAISLFLFIYFVAVGFFPIFFQTVFGFSTSQANALGNWMWGAQTAALILIGLFSDRLGVRKPFMLVGAVGAIVSTLLLIDRTGQPDTSYYTFVAILVPLALSLGLAFAPWMAGFTETVERRNPALTATGLALWGLTIRVVVTLSTFLLPYVVTTVTPLVQDGPTVQAIVDGADPRLDARQNAVVKAVAADPEIVTRVQSLATRYEAELATAATLSPATQEALTARPDDLTVQATAVSELSGRTVDEVIRAVLLGEANAEATATARTLNPDTRAALAAAPGDPAARAEATEQIAAGLGIPAGQAPARLDALLAMPADDLAFLLTDGEAVLRAADDLTALSEVPEADLAFLDEYGTPLQDPVVQGVLRYLEASGPEVAKAVDDSPGQWQTYFWIAVAGEVVFIPMIFLMAGAWRPRTARRVAAEHRAAVDAAIAQIAAAPPTPTAVPTVLAPAVRVPAAQAPVVQEPPVQEPPADEPSAAEPSGDPPPAAPPPRAER